MATRNLSIRLSTQDDKVVRRALETLGEKGQAALRRIERAGKPASKSLVGVNAAAADGMASMQGYAGRLGPVGAAMGAIGPAGLAAAAGVAALALAGKALVDLARETAEVGDQFDKMSKRTGFSTEVLSALAHAAQLSGASIESVESSLVRLQRRMVGASQGSKEYLNAFHFLNVEFANSNGTMRNAEAVFFDIADAVKQAGDSTETTNAITRILGRSATQLIPLMKEGGGAIRGMMQEARDLGVVITQEQAERAAKFNDEVLLLGQAWQGMKQDISFGLLGPLTEGVTKTRELLIETKKMTGSGFWGTLLTGARLLLPVPEMGRSLGSSEEVASQSQARTVAGALRPPAARGNVLFGAEVVTESTRIETPFARQIRQESEAILQPLEDMSGGLVDFGRNLEVDVDLMRKRDRIEAQVQASRQQSQAPLLALAQKEERIRLKLAGASQAQLAELGQLQGEELKLLEAREEGRAVLEQTTAAELKATQAALTFSTRASATADVLSRLAPELGHFAHSAATMMSLLKSPSQDPFSIAATGISLVMDLFGVGRQKVDSYAQGVERLNRVMIESAREIQFTVESLFSENDIFQAAQVEATGPIRGAFSAFQANNPDLRAFEQVREFLAQLSHLGTQSLSSFQAEVEGEGTTMNNTGPIAYFPGFLPPELIQAIVGGDPQADPEGAVAAFNAFMDELEAVFGPQAALQDVIRQSFNLSESFSELAATATGTSAALDADRRRVREEFNLERIALRVQAQNAFAGAGSDPFQRRQVFLSLSEQLSGLSAAEAAEIRALQGSGLAGAASPPNGSGTSGTNDPFALTLDPNQSTAVEDLLDLDLTSLEAFTVGIEGISEGARDLLRIAPLVVEQIEQLVDLSQAPPIGTPANQILAITDLMQIKEWTDLYHGHPRQGGLLLPPPEMVAARDILRIGEKLTFGAWTDLIEGHPRQGGFLLPPPVTINARDIIRVGSRLPITAFVDMGSLNSIIDNRVARAIRDRSLGDGSGGGGSSTVFAAGTPLGDRGF